MATPSSLSAKLKAERDRFAALAFVASDILMVLDDECRIAYVAGATTATIGRHEDDLIGQDFFEIVAPHLREAMREQLALSPGGDSRYEGVVLQLITPTFSPVEFSLSGYWFRHPAKCLYLGLKAKERPRQPVSLDDLRRDADTGLFQKDDFVHLISDRIAPSVGKDHPAELTMVEFKGLKSLRDHVDQARGSAFVRRIGEMLREQSINGDSAAHLGGDTFAFVAQANADVVSLTLSIEQESREIDASGQGVQASSARVEIDGPSLNRQELSKAIAFTFNSYLQRQGEDFDLKNLSSAYDEMIATNVRKVRSFKAIIEQGSFAIAYQPICDLVSRKVHHYEALVRFNQKNVNASPFSLITFAEEVGIIAEFDLALIRRAIDTLAEVRRTGYDVGMAVNVSARSLQCEPFVRDLKAMLEQTRPHPGSLLFELTESYAVKNDDLPTMNRILQEFRLMRYPVCLDDFGTGGAAFQYLRALSIDFVKIDGVYVREALTTPNGRAFAKAMAGLCTDLNVRTIAEMVENEDTINFLKDIGVGYGQGYYFGRPSFTLQQPKQPVLPDRYKRGPSGLHPIASRSLR